MWTYIDRELAEAVWQEELDLMSPEEITEYYDRLEKQQQKEIEENYWERGFAAMRGDDLEMVEVA